MNHNVRGLDHIALTVPDMEKATLFFRNAFGTRLAYDLHTPEEESLKGPEIEAMLGLRSGAELVHMRMLSLGESTSIELFCYHEDNQRSAAISSDFGLQHFAVYVDDIDNAAEKFVSAGGTLFTEINQIFGEIEGVDERNRFVYGKTPWGTVVELVTYPAGINYPDYSESNRFTPPKS
ncbi:VOC family protein [Citrobacter sp. wls619]|uniref:VOC family protein n=1 Tax=Citrobacter sp. wls619 TaxID=2576432 RepID=UPI0010C9FBFB|nr:VOC family protein [Citrobacter sp. wls619]TKV10788.1 VOC family protein [Citrobacter sp. wls619]